MRFDFSQIQDVESFVSVPPGTYRCRVAEVREGTARDGSVRWSYRLEVADGEFAGRTAAWDSVTWSERGVHRVRLALAAMGFDTTGVVDLRAHDLVGNEVTVTVQPEEREDPVTGRRQVRLRVPYAGYEHAPADEDPFGRIEANGG